METVWGLLRAVLIGLTLAILLLRLFEERWVFYPNLYSSNDWNPAAYGLALEDVFFTTSDGVRLHSWWAASPGATHTLVYLHGNAGNLSDRLPNIGFLLQLPANVLAVDYRGYGRSQGRPTEEGVYRDAEAAYDYLTRAPAAGGRGIPPEKIVALGQSLGVAVAVELARRRPVAGLILEGGFPSAKRVAQEIFWMLPGVRLVLRSKYDSAAKLKQLRLPVLVAHCQQDTVIPYRLGEELFAAANEPKTFVAYAGDCHEPLYHADPDDYAAQLRAFLESLRQ